MSSLRIEPCRQPHQPDWLALRRALWPQCPEAEHRQEMAAALAEPGRHAQWLAYAEQQPAGLLEMSLRCDYVNGTEHSPVAFVEGLYVSPRRRRQGCARALLLTAQRWAQDQGCLELATDTRLDNRAAQGLLCALGFAETERVVFFRRPMNELNVLLACHSTALSAPTAR